jgi:hypothetical protein
MEQGLAIPVSRSGGTDYHARLSPCNQHAIIVLLRLSQRSSDHCSSSDCAADCLELEDDERWGGEMGTDRRPDLLLIGVAEDFSCS